MEELFNGQLSFADIEAEKFLQIRRTHADRRVNAMDRLTDDVINELIQLWEARQKRPLGLLAQLVALWHRRNSSSRGIRLSFSRGSLTEPVRLTSH